MAKKKSKPRRPSLGMLGTIRLNLTFRVAEVQDSAGNSVFVLSRAVMDYLRTFKAYHCNWFAGSGHLCFLTATEWGRVHKLALDSNVDVIPFDGVWDLTDDPDCADMDVYEWAEACCKLKHPRGTRKVT